MSKEPDAKQDTNVASLPRPPRKVIASRFKLAEQTRRVWSFVPEHGTAFEDLLAPAYWSHVAKSLRPCDRIEITAEDGSYFAELFVTASERLSAAVAVLRKVEITPEALPEASAGHVISWKGPHLQFCVIRLADNARLKEKCANRDEAAQWLSNHLKAMAA